jgi:hypothetical protein
VEAGPDEPRPDGLAGRGEQSHRRGAAGRELWGRAADPRLSRAGGGRFGVLGAVVAHVHLSGWPLTGLC